MSIHLTSRTRLAARPRRGVVLIVLLAVFAIVATIAGAWARSVVQDRRVEALRRDRVQVRWLAEAGVRRAAARLSADPAYVGETWQIAASELGRPESAAVTIHIEPVVDGAGQVRLTARARYPQSHPRVRESKTVVVKLPGVTEP